MFKRINIWQKVILSSGVILWFYWWIKTFTSYKCENLTSTSGNCFIDSLILMPLIIGLIIALPTFLLFFIFSLGNKSTNKRVKKSKKHYLILGLILLIIFIIGFLVIKQNKKIKDSKINNKLTNVTCSRTEPYPMNPEFQRAISLIIQRTREEKSGYLKTISDSMTLIYNCLDIQYASSQEQIGGAEGIFYFYPSSTNDRLQILVSPKYKANDDILTASLLIHELTHATYYAFNIYNDQVKKISCYQNEADAYMNSFAFLFTLNPQERKSLTSRSDYGVEEVKTLFELTGQFFVEDNTSPSGKRIDTLPFVQNNPYYQKQCEGK